MIKLKMKDKRIKNKNKEAHTNIVEELPYFCEEKKLKSFAWENIFFRQLSIDDTA